ncbi:MAG: cysteine desulfurase [Candidatus Marsarchaeota archaeon]|jgi:cysteine desulfurase/selenocysteine lyase|nr:cysteine desulfurase [Candidatus Marsarchaeota archaeon]
MKRLDVESIRRDFPILNVKMRGHDLVYLDSAATSQKPVQVIDSIYQYYTNYNANIHRGIYELAELATDAYDGSKDKVAKFINANSMEEIVYVMNTTEAINLVALSWGEENIKEGDHILISEMEHHSNLVPWLLLANRKKAILDYIKLDESKTMIDMESLKEELEKDPKILAISHSSNVLGTINDVKAIGSLAHKHGAKVLVDGAQSAPHMPVDVRDIDCDFFAFSGHKMLGPTGIGTLYAKKDILNSMPPVIGGGDMIRTVEKYACTWNDLPWKFEAGTSNIEGGIGLSAAVDYLNKVGMGNIYAHERDITEYALKRLSEISNVSVFGPDYNSMPNRSGVISFAIEGVHPHDIASIFDSMGIAIRAGHHCAMPLVTELINEAAVARMSFYLYNRKDEVDRAIDAIAEVKKIFKIGR